ncbi:MAG TPA: CPBP family intramembrane glutamic endopeptidase [Pyrinomonadaceae bacterium]|nr:CPBP family intramembrane glutamic endopeptidase [Pyrinomonadaceae bacterium]
MRKIFLNDVGRLRSGWRVVIFVLAFIAVSFLIATVLRAGFAVVTAFAPGIPHPEFIAELIFRAGLLGAALGAGYLCTKFLEGLPWRSLGLTFHTGWFRDLAIGFAVGFGSLLIAVAIASKGLHFSFTTAGLATVRSLIGSLVLLFAAALAEEAMFRGYGLQTLSRAKLAWLGVLLTSVPFALVHLSNPNVVPVVTFANTALAGIWLAAAYLRTRSLWLALGVHWSWNWALGWFFGLPVSGINLVSNPLLQGQESGPKWLTGGTYGIEGGVACTISLILVTIFLWRTSLISATPELLKMTSEENPVTAEPVLTLRPADDQA